MKVLKNSKAYGALEYTLLIPLVILIAIFMFKQIQGKGKSNTALDSALNKAEEMIRGPVGPGGTGGTGGDGEVEEKEDLVIPDLLIPGNLLIDDSKIKEEIEKIALSLNVDIIWEPGPINVIKYPNPDGEIEGGYIPIKIKRKDGSEPEDVVIKFFEKTNAVCNNKESNYKQKVDVSKTYNKTVYLYILENNTACISGSGIMGSAMPYLDNITNLEINGDIDISNLSLPYSKLEQVIIKNVKIIPSVFENQKLTYLSLDKNVTKIEASAFSNNQIQVIDFSANSTLEEIGASAFRDNKLKGLVFPSSLRKIGDSAFKNNLLEMIQLNYGLINIGSEAFFNNYLTHVEIPETYETNQTYLISNQFKNNTIETITIKNNPENKTPLIGYEMAQKTGNCQGNQGVEIESSTGTFRCDLNWSGDQYVWTNRP